MNKTKKSKITFYIIIRFLDGKLIRYQMQEEYKGSPPRGRGRGRGS